MGVCVGVGVGVLFVCVSVLVLCVFVKPFILFFLHCCSRLTNYVAVLRSTGWTTPTAVTIYLCVWTSFCGHAWVINLVRSARRFCAMPICVRHPTLYAICVCVCVCDLFLGRGLQHVT